MEGNHTVFPFMEIPMFQSDIFEPNINFTLEEANGEVDGKHVLGKIKGCFFVPNGISRNNRFYPKDLWEKVLSNTDVKKKLLERRMFGTISHSQAIDDTALLEGKISHIVTNLGIVNGQGIGEALILDTPAGRVLNTFLRAGSKLFVSSRANGAFKGEENGVPRVDPESYELSGFDVVIDPGFVQANPKLVESLNKLLEQESFAINTNKNSEEDLQMKDVLESVAKENAALKQDLDKVMKEFTTTKNENTVLSEENSHVKSKFDKMEADIAEKSEKLKKYEALGKPEEIDSALDITDSKLKKYEALGGTPEELGETLTKSKVLLEDYSKIGTPSKIDEALDKAIAVMKSYSQLGSPAEIDESLEKGIATVTAYKAFGTVDELTTLFGKLEKSAASMKESKDSKKISEMAVELKVSEESIKELWGKLTEAQIRGFFAKMNPVVVTPVVAPVAPVTSKVESKKIAEKFTKKEVAPVVESVIDEEVAPMFSKSRGERMMEDFSK